MEPIKQHIYGGLNADDDFGFVKENQWVNSSGVRIMSTDKGATGRAESVGGTSLIFENLPDGINFCMGGCADEETQMLIYFNSNSNGENGIYAFHKPTQESYIVLLNSQASNQLFISKDTYIHSVEAVHGLLYWVDSNKTLCKINFKSAINMNHPGTFSGVEAYSDPIGHAEIKVIKIPPMRFPGVMPAVSSPAISYNLVDGNVFRFAWRFIYRDSEISVLSDFTEWVNMRYDQLLGYNSINCFCGGPLALIPKEAQIAELVVQYYPSMRAAVIKSWDRSVAAENDLMDNAVVAPLAYNFKNTEAGITLDPAYVIKHQEEVPVKLETLALAKNRLFLANVTNGLNSPKQTSLKVDSIVNSSIPLLTNPRLIFKSDTSRETCMVFYDRYFRRCGAVKGPRFVIPDMEYYVPGTVNKVEQVFLSVDNTNPLEEIPDWAWWYRPGVTSCDRVESFMQGHFSPGQFKYVYKDPATGILSYVDTLSTNPYGVGIDISELASAGLGYSFTEGDGDVMKLYLSNGNSYKKSILSADGSYVILPWDIMFTTNLSSLQGIFEIYNPKTMVNNSIYWEVDELNPINNPETTLRTYSNLTFKLHGDTWYIQRHLASALFTRFEAMSVDDKFWKEWVKSEMRANAVDSIGQKTITTAIQYSNVFIPGTKVNGLGSFEALNIEILDNDKGPIRKLQRANKIQEDGTVMLAIHENTTSSCYLGEQELLDSQGSAFVVKATNVIGSNKSLRLGMGTLNPESVFESNGLVYWWDVKNGCAVQYSNNGLFAISDNKLTRVANLISKQFQKTSAEQIENFGSRPFIVGGFDNHHKEVLFTIPKMLNNPPKGILEDLNIGYPYDIYDGLGKTLVYKQKGDIWCGDFPFEAEHFINIGNELFSLNKGKLYQHNQNTHGLFYEEQKPAMICLPVKAGAVCRFKSIALDANIKPSYVHLRTEEPYVQSSDLTDQEFKRMEATYYSYLMRDRLSPNAKGEYEEKQIKGDFMFGEYLLVMLQFDVSQTPLILKFITTGVEINKGHLQLKQN